MYTDSGSTIINNRHNWNSIILQLTCHDILVLPSSHSMRGYCKEDLFNVFNLTYDSPVGNTNQPQACVIIMKKCDKIINLVNEWISIASNLHLIDDSPSVLENCKPFFDHRHDQAIFALLLMTNESIHINYPCADVINPTRIRC